MTPPPSPQGLEGHLAWTGLTFLALLAFLFLPRQFHVAVVENTDERHLALASWAFPLYLLLLNLPILPLALLGRLHHPEVPPDLYVLAVAREGGAALAFLAFLGGVSAATAMVVVETLALSILVSHHLLAPLLLRRQALGHLLLFRRGTVLAVLLLAYLYFRLAGRPTPWWAWGSSPSWPWPSSPRRGFSASSGRGAPGKGPSRAFSGASWSGPTPSSCPPSSAPGGSPRTSSPPFPPSSTRRGFWGAGA